MKTNNLKWLWLSVLVILLDRLTKFWVVKAMPLGSQLVVTPFFNLVHARNYGAAFSFLDVQGGWQRWLFALISLVVSIVLLAWLAKLNKALVWRKAALALIIGGALGNFWGRFMHGYVVDFLDFHLGRYHYAAFNVADSAVSIGAVILIISLLRSKS